jgi:LysR family transcriptional regulator, glycine cleavage system transcriptional activator
MSSPATPRLPSIDGLLAFEAAARHGSFERAAEQLHITASAVSKRVSTLEDLLGHDLFVRAGRGLVLTPGGREYLAQAAQVLTLLTAMPQHQRDQQRMTRLRVSVPPTFGRQILVPQLATFTAAQPSIELEVVLSIPLFDGYPVDADIEVRHGEPALVGGEVLLHDQVLPVAAPAVCARLPALPLPTDLARTTLLRSPVEPWTPWLRAAGLDWPEPSQGPRLVDLGMTLEAAVSGQGVALARPTLARTWLGSGLLQPLFRIAAEPARRYQLMPHAAGAAATFAGWLRGLCAAVETEAEAVLNRSWRDLP